MENQVSVYVEFHIFPLCLCGFCLGSLVSLHPPKHAGWWTGNFSFPLSVNVYVVLYDVPLQPPFSPPPFMVHSCCTPTTAQLKEWSIRNYLVRNMRWMIMTMLYVRLKLSAALLRNKVSRGRTTNMQVLLSKLYTRLPDLSSGLDLML